MPRDAKGNVFGHGSKMKTPLGAIITVVGFATVSTGRINIDKLRDAMGHQYKYFRWVDVANIDGNEQSLAALDTTDHCAVDRAQTQLPPGVEVSAAPIDGDKVIWGS